MSGTKYLVRKNQYFDSVFLMGINKKLLDVDGVIQSAVLMGTQSNKNLLLDINVTGVEIASATANDLIVAVIAETEQMAENALEQIDDFFTSVNPTTSDINLRTLNDGLIVNKNANLVVISVPGEFAAREARLALEKDLNVFLFSSNVSVEDELELKNKAKEKNLLMMGPDCGTSIINGVGIGFANRVRKGPIGVIGPSGTGLQEFTSLVHHFGSGISHAIGTGTRDLKDSIGGITTISALNMLENDSATEVVAIVSKPVGEKTLAKLLKHLKSYPKPVVACFLGTDPSKSSSEFGISFTSTIDDAAIKSVALVGIDNPRKKRLLDEYSLKKQVNAYSSDQKYARGLFAGGTFCFQSQQILLGEGIEIYSNDPLPGSTKLQDPDKSVGHSLVDMGDEYYTMGKPHPMIDGTMRSLRITQEASDPQTAVILLDFILGFNSSNDPVGEAIEAIIAANKKPHHITFIASITGTDNDHQDLELQKQMLKDAGVFVTLSNASATKLCAELLRMRKL